MNQVDVTVRNKGTIFLFTPHTKYARDWIADHVSDETIWFGTAIVVEHGYARDLALGMIEDGLEVQ